MQISNDVDFITIPRLDYMFGKMSDGGRHEVYYNMV